MNAESASGSTVTPGWARFLELLGLSGLAVAQPVLAVFGEDPATFVAAGVGSAGIVLFGLGVILVPPAVLFLMEVAIGSVRSSWTTTVHLVLVGLLAGLVVLGSITGIGFLGPVIVYLAVIAALAILVLRISWPPMASWLRWLALATPLFLVSFLFVSPTSTLLAAESGTDTGQVTSAPPVLVIVLDELPTRSLLDGTGRIDDTAYPNLARLAAGATWYRNHVTVASGTANAIPALLSGVLPDPDVKQAGHRDLPGSLFTLFDEQADLVSLEWTTKLCAPGRCRRVTGGPSAGQSAAGLTGEALTVFAELITPDDQDEVLEGVSEVVLKTDALDANATRYLDLLRRGEQVPDASFVHIALPHKPWDFLPDGHQHALRTPSLVGDENGRLDKSRHLLQLEYTDQVVGEILEEVRALDAYDEAMVIVVGDHGRAFSGPEERKATPQNAADVAWSPLIIKYPGQREGEVVDDLARLTDVLPTVASVLETDLTWEVEGRDLRATDPPEASAPVIVRSSGDVRIDPADFARVLEADNSGRVDDAGLRVQSLHPLGELIGRSTADLPIDAPSPVAATLDGGLEREYDPAASIAPVAVDGLTDLPLGSTVAVTVNGRVGLLTPVVAEGDEARFFGLLPLPLFRVGTNELALYEVVDDASGPVLRPLPGD